ncbi:MAG: hypothetical protein ACE5KC_02930 [Candidatus Bathyarchaeia archaeon]
MSETVKLESQGLKLEIIVPPSVRSFKRTAAGIEFPCECGTKSLSVTSADFPIDDWERLTEALRQAEAWKKATQKASDFVDYYVRTEEVRRRFEERFGLLWTGGVLSQAVVTCHTCKRTYRFEIGVSVSTVAERLSPWEVYQRYPLKNTKAFKKTVAEWIHCYGDRHKPPINTAVDYIRHLKELEAAPKTAERFAEKIRGTIEATRTAEDNVVLNEWLEDVEGSFDMVFQDFKTHCEKLLKGYVEELASLITESTRLRVAPARL